MSESRSMKWQGADPSGLLVVIAIVAGLAFAFWLVRL
jgi:hypothetical protein